MTPDELYDAGRRLFGLHWMAALSCLLGFGERPLRRWLAGQNPIPEGIARNIEELLEIQARSAREAAQRWEDHKKPVQGDR